MQKKTLWLIRNRRLNRSSKSSILYVSPTIAIPAQGHLRQPLIENEQGEITKDAIYVDADRRFKELEDETKKLHEESKK